MRSTSRADPDDGFYAYGKAAPTLAAATDHGIQQLFLLTESNYTSLQANLVVLGSRAGSQQVR